MLAARPARKGISPSLIRPVKEKYLSILINKLNYNLVLGYNAALTKENKPYNEFSIGLSNLGWGKVRFLRVDYVRAYSGSGLVNDTFLFGFSF